LKQVKHNAEISSGVFCIIFHKLQESSSMGGQSQGVLLHTVSLTKLSFNCCLLKKIENLQKTLSKNCSGACNRWLLLYSQTWICDVICEKGPYCGTNII